MQLASGHAHWQKVRLTKHVACGWLSKHRICLPAGAVLCVSTVNGQLTHGLANGDVLVSLLSIPKLSLILPQLNKLMFDDAAQVS